MYPKSDFKPVPANIHMVWVGSRPGAAQQDYLKQWAAKNPESKVNLWVDSQQFGAYAANKSVRQQVDALFSGVDAKAYQGEKLFRGLFSQVAATLGRSQNPLSEMAQRQALSELNKELAAPGNEQWKQDLLPAGGNVTARNAASVLATFRELTKANDEKFMQADALVLNQTVVAWDSRGAPGTHRDVQTLDGIKALFADTPNVHVRDLSNPEDISLRNRDAYQHEIIGRNGAYPAASDIARYEILHQYGGVYADIDLECTQPLADKLLAHPDLMLVGLAQGKREASGAATPYFANALLAAHPGSKMLDELIGKIGDDYGRMKGNEFSGDRYFSRPNKSTIETTGPNALRGHVNAFVSKAQDNQPLHCDAQSLAQRIWSSEKPEHQGFWAAVETHLKFPDGLVNFETDEQQQSATKSMA